MRHLPRSPLRAAVMAVTAGAITAVAVACGVAVAKHRAVIAPAVLSSGIERVLAEDTAHDQATAATRAFYAARHFTPAWIDGRGPTEAAAAALDALASARTHGLSPAAYDMDALAAERLALADGHAAPANATSASHDSGAPVSRDQALLAFEVGVTRALLQAGHDVAVGRVDPSRVDPRWRSARRSPDLAAALNATLASPGAASGQTVRTWLTTVEPPHAEYAALRRALEHPEQLPPATATDTDRAIAMREVALNLERWRWMPDTLGDRRVFVNIPSYELVASDGGRHTPLRMRVVVGKPKTNETPVLSSEIRQVVFSPYWNIPQSIVERETLPSMSRDPDYLTKENIEVVRTSATAAPLYRQRPGAKNALGLVKFLFPNPFEVYLHDTPTVSAFQRDGRALSHGCVRLQQPKALAEWVLDTDPDWTPETIGRAMHAGAERWVRLATPVPVHIAYFTAVTDATGHVTFLKDPYGYDVRQRGAF